MIPGAKEVEQARELLGRYLRPTRLVSAESLARRSGARVYLKMETDLPTGSFKPRGALSALLTNMAQRALPGVVVASNFSVLATDPARGLSLSSVAWSRFVFRGGRGD